MTNREKQAHKIANNALYFDDGADFVSALWDILTLFDKEAECIGDLEYMEDETDNPFLYKADIR